MGGTPGAAFPGTERGSSGGKESEAAEKVRSQLERVEELPPGGRP